MQHKKALPAIGLIGLLIVSIVALVYITLTADTPLPPLGDPAKVAHGPFGLYFDASIPPIYLLIIAALLALVAALFIETIEVRASNRSRRSLEPSTYPLSPRVISENTKGHYSGPIKITIIIPAHNESDLLLNCIAQVRTQLRPIDRIIVISDNSKDGTTELAYQAGVEVYETVNNTQKKAGALNQILGHLAEGLGNNDVVMVLDADTVLDPGFIETAVHKFENDRGLSAIGGVFYGEQGFGIIGQLQRNEYVRYARLLKRRRGRVFVLTGTSTMIRANALRVVAESRGTMLPGTKGDVYDTHALTEDNELTMALKTLGALMESPSQCGVVTEVMRTRKQLWAQRMRWQRGALENVGQYGVTRTTLRYWGQQLGLGYSAIALSSYLLLMLLTFLAVDNWIWFPFWLGVGGIFIIERLVSVWAVGWKGRFLAVLLIPELVYDMFLNAVFLRSLIDIAFNRSASWGHIDTEHTPNDLKGSK